VLEVAHDLVGCTLLLDGVGGRLVEVEAYDPADPASHSFRGPTARNAAMFGPPGHAYVYRSYGIHWLLNLVCGPVGYAAAVLVRALVPEHGLDRARARRPGVPDRDLCRGPGRLSLALAVRPEHDGLALDEPPFGVHAAPAPVTVEATPRIGITRGVERDWRFAEAGSRFVSG
jgi:DNA-3-methyladenine glycosylase